MQTLNVTIKCNGTESEILASLKDLISSYEIYGISFNSEDAWTLAEITEPE